MISRREFVKIGAAVGAGVMLPAWMAKGAFAFNPGTQPAPANPLRLTKYMDKMPIMGLMPSAAPNYYRVGIYQFKSKVHSQMPPTTVWGPRPLGFVPSLTRPEATWLGPTFAVPRGTPVKVEWLNKLNGVKHPLPVDPSIMYADPLNDAPPMGTVYPVDSQGLSTFNYTLNTVPLVTHLHGGENPPCSDGGPFGWFTPGFAQVGPEWANAGDVDPAFSPTGKHNVYPYPNGQLPATLFYHDHALGLDRLAVYMGFAGGYAVYDPALEPGFSLAVPQSGIPSVLDTVVHGVMDKFGQAYDIPLVIQDRVFDSKGQLWYPGREATNPETHPFWVPEFFGDTICVNGVAWPKLPVEGTKYRFRVIAGSNARFYNMSLRVGDPVNGVAGPPLTVIASDQGFLMNPAVMPSLVIGTGERYEFIIDFAGLEGQNVYMVNDAPAPWPDGDPVNPLTTGQIMKFEVDPTPVTPMGSIPAVLNTVFGGTFPSIGATPILTRQLTLNEIQGPGGPFAVVENFSALDLPTTETPQLGTTEIWRIVNMTVDGHPIHLHGSSFQVKSRQQFLHETDPTLPGFAGSYDEAWAQAFGLGNRATAPFDPIIPQDPIGPPASVNPALSPSGYAYPGTVLADGSTLVGGNPDVTPFLVAGTLTGPQPEEIGWKDTAKMLPGQVTEIIVRISPNDNTPSFPYTATAPLGYVWHCHILEHEENDMMRRSRFLP